MQAQRLNETERLRPEKEFGPVRQAVADAIYKVLRDEHSLHRKVIVERVKAKGIPIESANPVQYIATLLSLDDRFERIHHYGYWKLAAKSREICRNGLHGNVQWNREIHTKNETAEGSSPSTVSTKREVDSPMATLNATTESQVENDKTPTFNIITALGPDDPDDGNIGRQQRGLSIAAVSHVKRTKVGFSVKSQSGSGKWYAVRMDGVDGPACECDDF